MASTGISHCVKFCQNWQNSCSCWMHFGVTLKEYLVSKLLVIVKQHMKQ